MKYNVYLISQVDGFDISRGGKLIVEFPEDIIVSETLMTYETAIQEHRGGDVRIYKATQSVIDKVREACDMFVGMLFEMRDEDIENLSLMSTTFHFNDILKYHQYGDTYYFIVKGI